MADGSGTNAGGSAAELLLDGRAAIVVNSIERSQQGIGGDRKGWLEGTRFGGVDGALAALRCPLRTPAGAAEASGSASCPAAAFLERVSVRRGWPPPGGNGTEGGARLVAIGSGRSATCKCWRLLPGLIRHLLTFC